MLFCNLFKLKDASYNMFLYCISFLFLLTDYHKLNG
jgi:hypothetical protein